jgi:hypothetical protein
MTAPFMRAYTELLVKTCHRRGAHAIGGMAAQIPIKDDPEANEQAFAKVRYAIRARDLPGMLALAESTGRTGRDTISALVLGVDPLRLQLPDGRISFTQPGIPLYPADVVVALRFTRRGGFALAYQVLGEGPIDLVFIPGFTGHLEIRWEDPTLSRLFRRLATGCRLVLFDKRGTGMSDREGGYPPLPEHVDDLLAVMDAVEEAAEEARDDASDDEAGVAGITFHPRTIKVRHKGTPDYELAASLVESLPVPVIVTVPALSCRAKRIASSAASRSPTAT